MRKRCVKKMPHDQDTLEDRITLYRHQVKELQAEVKELREIGIQPDILLCRADRSIPVEERRKIALFCNLRPEAVIQALDVDTIYQVPAALYAGLPIIMLVATISLFVTLARWHELTALKAALKQPLIFDGRNIYDPAMMKMLGFEYHGVGRPAVLPTA